MPRLTHSLLRRANGISPLLSLLLKTTRTLPHAILELCWLRAHASTQPNPPAALRSYIRRRATLCEPLQYILGTQPFGTTEILCRRGVLIPRAETEETASHLASLLKRNAKVVDLCTGTGCIPLLLAAQAEVATVGVDISPRALSLAVQNRSHNSDALKAASKVEFIEGDVLGNEEELLYSIHACFDEIDPQPPRETVDVVVANPPYISAGGYARETARSVRLWEPRLALEADQDGDVFYPHIGRIAWELGAAAVVAEVGGLAQAERVRGYWEGVGWVGSAVWKDFAGKGRTVVAWREGGEWVKNGPNP